MRGKARQRRGGGAAPWTGSEPQRRGAWLALASGPKPSQGHRRSCREGSARRRPRRVPLLPEPVRPEDPASTLRLRCDGANGTGSLCLEALPKTGLLDDPSQLLRRSLRCLRNRLRREVGSAAPSRGLSCRTPQPPRDFSRLSLRRNGNVPAAAPNVRPHFFLQRHRFRPSRFSPSDAAPAVPQPGQRRSSGRAAIDASAAPSSNASVRWAAASPRARVGHAGSSAHFSRSFAPAPQRPRAMRTELAIMWISGMPANRRRNPTARKKPNRGLEGEARKPGVIFSLRT